MKKVLFMLSVLAALFVFSGCSDDDEPSINSELVGVWEEYGNDLGYEVFHIELRANGTGDQWAEDYGEIDEYGKTSFTWSSTSDKITVNIEGAGSRIMDYSLRDNMLYLSYEDETIIYIRE